MLTTFTTLWGWIWVAGAIMLALGFVELVEWSERRNERRLWLERQIYYYWPESPPIPDWREL